MDNGRVQDIREFQVNNPAVAEQEVRRMAGLAMAAGAENQNFGTVPEEQIPSVARERAQELGWQVIEGGVGNDDAGVRESLSSAEVIQDLGSVAGLEATRALETAALEISEDENRLENPERFVGMPTPIEMDERLARQNLNLENDVDPKRSRGAEIAARSQEKIAQRVMDVVEDLLKKKQVSPWNLIHVQQEEGEKMRQSFEEPYEYGEN